MWVLNHFFLTVHCPNIQRMFGKFGFREGGKEKGFLRGVGIVGGRMETGWTSQRDFTDKPLLGNETIS